MSKLNALVRSMEAEAADRKYKATLQVLTALIAGNHKPRITEEDLIEDPEGLITIEYGQIREWEGRWCIGKDQKTYSVRTTIHQRMVREAMQYIDAVNQHF